MKEQEEEEGQGDKGRAEGDGEWRGERSEEKGKMWGRLERNTGCERRKEIERWDDL